jgi:hypothetical protein
MTEVKCISFCPTVTSSALIAALVQLCSPLSSLAAILAQTAQPQEEKVPLRDLHNFLFFDHLLPGSTL